MRDQGRRMRTLKGLLDEVGSDPGAPVVHAGDTTWTVADVRARAAALAETLTSEAAVRPGHGVGVMLADGPEVVAALFGVWGADAVYVPLNPRLTDAELTRILAAVEPAAVITAAEDSGRFGEIAVVVPEADGSCALHGRTAGQRRQHDPDIALIQFTSGTTGPPKPVLLRHSGVLELLDNVISALRGKPASGETKRPMPNLVPVSLSLWAGIYQILFALRVGAPVVVLGRFDTKRFADAVHRFGIRSTVLPPAAMTMLCDDRDVSDLSPLKYVRSITAPLSPLQAHRFRDRFGLSVLNCYGQTEIGGEIIGWNASDLKEHGDKLGAVGRPHDGVSLRVVDTGGHDLPRGEAGELWVRTPSLSAGYADGSDLADRMSDDGWFRTGDIARIDEAGFVWIEGRVSDMINRGGLKVFPAEVAEALRLDPAVADAAVVGVPDSRLGEVPWAFVVPQPGESVDAGRLEQLCREHLAPYKVPVRFETIAELPRNEVGKVLNRQLVEKAGASTP